MALFLCPKGHWLIRAMRGIGKAAPVALHGEGGYSLSRKRVSPLTPPRERTRGLPPRPRCIGSFRLEELRGLRNLVRCTWLRHGSLRFVTTRNRALLREARVTIAQRRTACWRHCCAHRGTGAKNDRVSGRFLLWESHRAPVRKLRCGA